ncbi:MAG: hypothetical protein MI757_01685, partial [Pirellulales bacterium]|nr:hypothetical protein [Pirellulales bacterium]
MVLAAGGDTKLMRCGGEDEIAVARRAAEQLGLETTMAAIAVLDQTLTRMRQSTHVRTLVEIALVRICRLEDLESLSTLIADLKNGTAPAAPKKNVDGVTSPAQSVPAPTPKPVAEKPERSARPSAVAHDVGATNDVVRAAPQATPDTSTSPTAAAPSSVAADVATEASTSEQDISSPAVSIETATADAAWKKVVAQLHDEGNLLASHAECSEKVTVDDAGCLVVSFTEQAAFHRSACERPDAKAKLEQSVRAIVGSAVRLRFDTAEGVPTPVMPKETKPSPREQQKAIAEHPMIKRAEELFAAEIVGPPRKAR